MGKFLVHTVALDRALKHGYPFVARPMENESGWFTAYAVDKDYEEYAIVDGSDEETVRGFCRDHGLHEVGSI